MLPLTLVVHADDRGLPVVRTYSADDYHGGAQNFAMTQDARGLLYFANLQGVLVYDGAWWRKVELPNQSAVFAVASDPKGALLAGGVGELGFVERAEDGTLTYESLMPRVHGGARNLGDVVSICHAPGGFVVTTDRGIFTVTGMQPKQIAQISGERVRCAVSGDDVWLAGNGLRHLTATGALEPRAPALNGKTIDAIVGSGAGRVVASVHGEGLVAVDAAGNVTPFAPEASAWLRERSVTDAVRLHDGRLALTTREDGVAIVRPDGTLDQLLAPMSDDVMRAAYADRDGTLWLVTDAELEQVSIGNGLTVWDSRRGVKSTVQRLVHWNAHIYIATAQGVEVIEANQARRIAAVGNVSAWDLLPAADGALIATSTGILHMTNDERVTRVPGTESGAYMLLQPSWSSDTVWFCSRTGAGILRRDAGGWHLQAMLEGMPRHTRVMLEDHGTIWCGTTFDGIVRIDDPTSPHPRITRIGVGEWHVARSGGRLVAVHSGQILRIDGNHLANDPDVAQLDLRTEFFNIIEDSARNLWINSMPPTMYRRLPDGKLAREGEPLIGVNGTTCESMEVEPHGVMWFGTERGLYRYEPTPMNSSEPAPIIAGVRFVGHRRMRIEFAPLSYRPGVTYQYRLDPSDADWSGWTPEPFIDFTNLPGGQYTFRLRARGAGTPISPETRWSFTVQPPWYQTTTARIVWLLLAIAIVAIIVALRTAALHRQAAKLRGLIAQRTAELYEKNELLEQANARLERLSLVDELTGVANRRYFQRALDEEWSRAAREGKPLALIMLDLDHFKHLNDTLGHPAGDDCLRQIGAYLGSLIRRTGDVVARYGGEEFAVLLVGTGSDNATQVAERLRTGIASLLIPVDAAGRTLTASFGVAAFVPAQREPSESLVQSADKALYAAKEGGRNCVRTASESDRAIPRLPVVVAHDVDLQRVDGS